MKNNDDLSEEICKLILKMKEGVRQIELSDKTLRLRDKLPALKEKIEECLASKNIEIAQIIRGLLMDNAGLEGEPYKSDVFTTQIAIDGKATDLKTLNGKLDHLLAQIV